VCCLFCVVFVNVYVWTSEIPEIPVPSVDSKSSNENQNSTLYLRGLQETEKGTLSLIKQKLGGSKQGDFAEQVERLSSAQVLMHNNISSQKGPEHFVLEKSRESAGVEVLTLSNIEKDPIGLPTSDILPVKPTQKDIKESVISNGKKSVFFCKREPWPTHGSD